MTVAVTLAAPPPSGPPLQPLVPLTILDASGNPVRSDNASSFAYVGPNDGVTQPPELFTAYNPTNPTSTTPIQPGQTTQLRNTHTGLYCRLAQLPSTYPVSKAKLFRVSQRQPPPLGRIKKAPRTTRNASMQQTSTSCNTQGIICDQPTVATATVLTYTGSGMSFNGTPLVQSTGSKTLILSSDPACTVPNGGILSLPPAIRGAQALLFNALQWKLHVLCLYGMLVSLAKQAVQLPFRCLIYRYC